MTAQGGDAADRPARLPFAALARRWQERPVATRALILLQVWIFVLPFAAGVVPLTGRELTLPADTGADWLWHLGALLPWAQTRDEPWRLLTAMSLHAGVLHLAVNMIALHSLGSVLERLGGSHRFLVIYAASGLAGTIASSHNLELGVSVGASGAIFGVGSAVVAHAVRLRHRLPPGVSTRIAFPLAVLLAALLLLLPWVAEKLGVRIDHVAHTAGAITGLALGLLPALPGAVARKGLGIGTLLLLTTSGLIPCGRVLLDGESPVSRTLETAVVYPLREAILDELDLRLEIPVSWQRIEREDRTIWLLNGQEVLRVTFEPAPVTQTPDILSQVDLLLGDLEGQKARGEILDYEILVQEDLIGHGIGGYLIGFARVPQDDAWLFRFIDLPQGATVFRTLGPATPKEIQKRERMLRSIGRRE